MRGYPTNVCRLCQLFIAYNRSLALLGRGSFQLQLLSRVCELFDVSVDSNDSLPQHVATLEVQAVSGTVGERNEGQPTRSRALETARSNSFPSCIVKL